MEFPRRYKFQWVPGADNIADLIPAPGEVIEEGTPINKATMLTDETASLLDGAETVDLALKKLAELANTAQSTADGKVSIEVGSYTGTGATSKTITFTNIEPKFVVCLSPTWGNYGSSSVTTLCTISIAPGWSGEPAGSKGTRRTTYDGKSVTFRDVNGDGPYYYGALNYNGYMYYYVGIG